MTDLVTITVDGREYQVAKGIPLAVALLTLGLTEFRKSIRGEPRAAVCGMGVCFECRVTLAGKDHQRSCLVACVAGMVVETGR